MITVTISSIPVAVVATLCNPRLLLKEKRAPPLVEKTMTLKSPTKLHAMDRKKKIYTMKIISKAASTICSMMIIGNRTPMNTIKLITSKTTAPEISLTKYNQLIRCKTSPSTIILITLYLRVGLINLDMRRTKSQVS